MIKVSAIITTHNRLSLLKRAVDSVNNQSYDNIELIVVDDHSSDGSVEWCIDYNVTVIQSPLRGGNVARNIGIRHATGNYIAFLDDDDYWYEDKIAKQVRLAESSGCAVIYCGIRKTIKQNDEWRYEYIYPRTVNTGDVSHRVLQEIFTVTSALMVKRELLMSVGLFDENLNFWQEYELCIRLAQKSAFNAVDEILVDYLVDSGDKNRLTNKYDNWKKTVKNIHRKHSDIYSELPPLERIWADRVEIWDAISRSENAGLNLQRRINRMRLKISFLKERLVKKLLVKSN